MNPVSRLIGLGALIALAVMFMAGPASGVVPMHLTYPSTGACAQSSTGLNDCIASATPSSTITIKPGTYYENSTAVGTNVTITGSCSNPQAVTIDQETVGDGFAVGASNVTIECLTLRHGGTNYDGIDNELAYDNLHVMKVDAFEEDYGVYSPGGGATGLSVTGSTMRGLDEEAVYSNAVTNPTITGNTFGNTGSHCVDLTSATNGTISNNNIGPCDSYGIYIDGGDTNTVAANTIHTARSSCFDIASSHTTVTKNVTNGCDGTALYIDADNATVTNNTFTGLIGGDTIKIDCGDNAVVSGNVASTGNDDAPFIDVCQSGTGHEMITNNVQSSGLVSYGVECVTCDNSTITGNKVVGGGEDDAFYVYGASPVVTNNVGMGGWNDETFYVQCASGCSSAQAENNVEAGSNSGYGFEIYSNGCGAFPCMTISGNTATDNTESGFYLHTTYADITGNKASFSGYSHTGCYYSGFEVAEGFNTLTGNTATSNACQGFYVGTPSNTLQSNTATGNFVHGFQVEGASNTLISNIATGNFGDGFNNDGTNTTFTNNKASGNRQDCTNDNQAPSAEGASISSATGNVCKDLTNFNVASTLTGW
jgi:parallel beta-helix repeat protein